MHHDQTQTTQPEEKQELVIRNIDPKLKKDFKAKCAEAGITMRDQLITFMDLWVKHK